MPARPGCDKSKPGCAAAYKSTSRNVHIEPLPETRQFSWILSTPFNPDNRQASAKNTPITCASLPSCGFGLLVFPALTTLTQKNTPQSSGQRDLVLYSAAVFLLLLYIHEGTSQSEIGRDISRLENVRFRTQATATGMSYPSSFFGYGSLVTRAALTPCTRPEHHHSSVQS
jgi:hypothetical protein